MDVEVVVADPYLGAPQPEEFSIVGGAGPVPGGVGSGEGDPLPAEPFDVFKGSLLRQIGAEGIDLDQDDVEGSLPLLGNGHHRFGPVPPPSLPPEGYPLTGPGRQGEGLLSPIASLREEAVEEEFTDFSKPEAFPVRGRREPPLQEGLPVGGDLEIGFAPVAPQGKGEFRPRCDLQSRLPDAFRGEGSPGLHHPEVLPQGDLASPLPKVRPHPGLSLRGAKFPGTGHEGKEPKGHLPGGRACGNRLFVTIVKRRGENEKDLEEQEKEEYGSKAIQENSPLHGEGLYLIYLAGETQITLVQPSSLSYTAFRWAFRRQR